MSDDAEKVREAVRVACADPGQFTQRRTGDPGWPAGPLGQTYEPLSEWQARAVLAALDLPGPEETKP